MLQHISQLCRKVNLIKNIIQGLIIKGKLSLIFNIYHGIDRIMKKIFFIKNYFSAEETELKNKLLQQVLQ